MRPDTPLFPTVGTTEGVKLRLSFQPPFKFNFEAAARNWTRLAVPPAVRPLMRQPFHFFGSEAEKALILWSGSHMARYNVANGEWDVKDLSDAVVAPPVEPNPVHYFQVRAVLAVFHTFP